MLATAHREAPPYRIPVVVCDITDPQTVVTEFAADDSAVADRGMSFSYD
ncbi:MAG: hypothetical protein K2Y31_06915 [Burkholderiales bacterium]|jgi:hypothetical protein|nr:hypothetical protein [Burkholderiales bacterium]